MRRLRANRQPPPHLERANVAAIDGNARATAISITPTATANEVASLQQTVERQAASSLEARMGRVRQTMALEAQEGETLPASERAQLEAIIGAGRLWSQRDEKR
jgi:hypothetical protein